MGRRVYGRIITPTTMELSCWTRTAATWKRSATRPLEPGWRRTSVMMSSYGLSLVLAVIACVIGGVLGGLTLARPGSVLGLTALEADIEEPANDLDPTDAPASAPAGGLAEGRALGG